MIFYIDTAVFTGWIMNFICLDISAGVMKLNSGKVRLAVASFILSVLGVAGVLYGIVRILYIPVYVIVLRMLWGKSGICEWVRRFFICMGISVLWSALYLTTVPGEYIGSYVINGGMMFVVPDTVFFVVTGLVYVSVKVIMFFFTAGKRFFNVRIKVCGQSFEGKAFLDTGNSLSVPGTGEPVIFADRCLVGNLPDDGMVIRCKTVSDAGSLIRIYPVEDLYFTEENRHMKNVYISFTTAPLDSKGKFNVLLHKSI